MSRSTASHRAPVSARLLPIVAALALGVGGCAAGSATPDAPSPATERPTAGTPASGDPVPSASASAGPTAAEGAIEGMFDVGGHSLYLSCAGTGSPTIVYMHGAIDDRSIYPHGNGIEIQRMIEDEYRMCVYDRRNLGRSDSVDAPQTPDDAMADLRNLLAAAGVEPPLVLLGASFGGNLAYLYANTHPDEVVGMVLLDSQFPDELSLEHLVPAEERYEAYHEEDQTETLERISHYAVFEQGQPFIGNEPEIPVTYFSSIPEGVGTEDFGQDPAYNEQILQVQEAFVDRFSPGTYLRVDAPHFMEPAIPDEIVEALRTVISQAGI